MFTGLILFVAAIIFVAVKLLKATRALFRGSNGQKEPKEEKKTNDKPQKEPAKEEVSQEQEKPLTLEESLGEEVMNRYDAAHGSGIYEIFWKEDADLSLNGKELADAVTGQCGITYLEFNNRMLAGRDFRGFNLLLDEGKKLTLTYYGKAIASIAKIESKIYANGQDTGKTRTIFRTNTFPPHLSEGMVVADVERMLSLRQLISSCIGHPTAVYNTMLDQFCSVENSIKIKRDIGPKIQAKESTQKQSYGTKAQPDPKLKP